MLLPIPIGQEVRYAPETVIYTRTPPREKQIQEK